ncbi:MAG: CBS domain-containing protein [Candidatus Latescibacteria bacterium]|nr:CBS domain-containing protein [Candidatus Latescibacterota bacterium]NIO55272.1 CBS domain-containing protein [Candidatus Latescibacterota bacterium]
MIRLENYATVSQEATLLEAVIALEKAHERQHHDRYRHRAVLVRDNDDRIVGKLSMLDVLRALEPRYREITDFSHSMRFGFSTGFIKSMVKKYDLWQKPLDDLCRKAAQINVKNIMYTPAEGEYVRIDATLDEAVHQLVVGHHQSLLVIDDEKNVVGILRLTDVFSEVCNLIKASQP